jgi:hypothetical protein
MAARLDNLAPEERRVVEAASVAGLTFAQAAVEELVPPELRDRAGEHLVSLTRKQFVRPDAAEGHDGATFRFRHVAIRDAAYGSLLKRTRSAMHERFAEWADRAVGDRAVGYEEILAWYLEQATARSRSSARSTCTGSSSACARPSVSAPPLAAPSSAATCRRPPGFSAGPARSSRARPRTARAPARPGRGADGPRGVR